MSDHSVDEDSSSPGAEPVTRSAAQALLTWSEVAKRQACPASTLVRPTKLDMVLTGPLQRVFTNSGFSVDTHLVYLRLLEPVKSVSAESLRVAGIIIAAFVKSKGIGNTMSCSGAVPTVLEKGC